MNKNYLIVPLSAALLYGCATGDKVTYRYETHKAAQTKGYQVNESIQMILEKRTDKSIEELIQELEAPKSSLQKEGDL